MFITVENEIINVLHIKYRKNRSKNVYEERIDRTNYMIYIILEYLITSN